MTEERLSFDSLEGRRFVAGLFNQNRDNLTASPHYPGLERVREIYQPPDQPSRVLPPNTFDAEAFLGLD